MRPLLAVIIYLTVLCGASVSAGYLSLVFAEQWPKDGEAILETTEPESKKAYFASKASHFLWGMTGGGLIYVVAHLFGFCWLKGGLANLRAEPDPEDLLNGLWVHFGAAVLAALIGGAVGYLAG